MEDCVYNPPYSLPIGGFSNNILSNPLLESSLSEDLRVGLWTQSILHIGGYLHTFTFCSDWKAQLPDKKHVHKGLKGLTGVYKVLQGF